MSRRDALRRCAPLAALALGLVIATAPAWRVLLLGDHPTIEDLLSIRCTPGR